MTRMTRMTRLSALFVVKATTGVPIVLDQPPVDDTPCLALTALPEIEANGFTFAVSDKGDVIAIATEGETVTEFGLAEFNKTGMLIFAPAALRQEENTLELVGMDEAVVLLTPQGDMLSIDPHIVASAMAEADLGVKMSMLIKVEGETLQFLPTNSKMQGNDVTFVQIAGQVYPRFTGADFDLVTCVTKSGRTFVGFSSVAVIEYGAVAEMVDFTALVATFGIGTPSAELSVPGIVDQIAPPCFAVDMIAA